ncbi:telokin-like protein [Lymantria xylina nucleopolyhedrovirus]|uniref:Telokin-like protein n=1 Tax=Lymantria xylina multiple nucleopolyhedrovirus TaxID=2847840 RepID=D4N2C3_9ABAC|nr:telokin-like protein [Lymantria xylina nucleopolyhedrovirus]ADD73795.1 telokin-like protein [Lymantria xylina nucleopolyhedrovirus]
MAANSSDTVNIAAYVTLDKEEFRHTLSFIVQDEYHLKKLTVGAYNINVLDTQLLDGLLKKRCYTIVCGNYNVIYNFTEEKKLRVMLFNASPIVLKKHSCIFKIVVPSNKTRAPSPQPSPISKKDDDDENDPDELLTVSRGNSNADSGSRSEEEDDDAAEGGAGATAADSEDDLPAPFKKQRLDDVESN